MRGTAYVECDTDDEDGKYPTGCTDPKMAASMTKLVLEEGKTESGQSPIVTRNPELVFNPNFDNASMMDGNSDNANAIWLRNWRRSASRCAKDGRLVLQVLVQGGPSEMQRAEKHGEVRASRSSSYTSTRRRLSTWRRICRRCSRREDEAEGEERTITYYPEAVVLKGTPVAGRRKGMEAGLRARELRQRGSRYRLPYSKHTIRHAQ